jgi:hypothetical protein
MISEASGAIRLRPAALYSTPVASLLSRKPDFHEAAKAIATPDHLASGAMKVKRQWLHQMLICSDI